MNFVDTLAGGAPTTQYFGKRALDLFVGGTACVVFAPLVIGIAAVVWLEDRNSPWFLQSRVGRDRKLFTIVKLRTMRDREVTRVGRWLRRTGLDELPQFLNVMRGEMSIVGPRPLTQPDIDRLAWQNEQHDWRFAVTPGITGLAQLFGGVSARSSRRLDRLYLYRQSVGLDVRVIALSFAVNVFGKAAVRRWSRSVVRRRTQ